MNYIKDIRQGIRCHMDAHLCPYTSSHNIARTLQGLGYKKTIKRDHPLSYNVYSGTTVIAADTTGLKNASHAYVKCISVHIDSPTLKLRNLWGDSQGTQYLYDLDCYGGGKWHTWVDRCLGLSGQLTSLRHGTILIPQINNIGIIPGVAIHLQNKDERDGKMDDEKHLKLLGPDVVELINKTMKLDLKKDDIVCHDLRVHESKSVDFLGGGAAHDDLIVSGRLDNQISVWALLHSLERGNRVHEHNGIPIVCVYAFWDSEEIGSLTLQGARGAAITAIMKDLNLTAIHNGSLHLSIDVSHAHHPLYAEKHLALKNDAQYACTDGDTKDCKENVLSQIHPKYQNFGTPTFHIPLYGEPFTGQPQHARRLERPTPSLGSGITLKWHPNGAYATSPHSAMACKVLFNTHAIPYSLFGRPNGSPCGSTVGPALAAALNMHTADIGIPLWSMHSARETVSLYDAIALSYALTAWSTNAAIIEE